jgi:hypothetical protein
LKSRGIPRADALYGFAEILQWFSLLGSLVGVGRQRPLDPYERAQKWLAAALKPLARRFA